MQQSRNSERAARASLTAAMIRRAIQGRACLSGKHVEFRVSFAPHARGRDEKGRRIVVAFEYGGLTLGRAHWVCFALHRLRSLQRTGDPWRNGSLEGKPQFDLTEIEATVNDTAFLTKPTSLLDHLSKSDDSVPPERW